MGGSQVSKAFSSTGKYTRKQTFPVLRSIESRNLEGISGSLKGLSQIGILLVGTTFPQGELGSR